MRTVRALLFGLSLAALTLPLTGVEGVHELALYAAPVLALLGLLAGGWFIGEDAILARRAEPARRRPRPRQRRWTPGLERALASQLERTRQRLRGPPVAAPA